MQLSICNQTSLPKLWEAKNITISSRSWNLNFTLWPSHWQGSVIIIFTCSTEQNDWTQVRMMSQEIECGQIEWPSIEWRNTERKFTLSHLHLPPHLPPPLLWPKFTYLGLWCVHRYSAVGLFSALVNKFGVFWISSSYSERAALHARISMRWPATLLGLGGTKT